MSFRDFLLKRNSRCVPIKEGNSIIFYINTAGFPLMDEVWTHMWNYANQLQPEAAQDFQHIQENKHNLPNADVPQPPYSLIYNKQASSFEKLEKLQNYINKLQYNHTGLQFFEIKKDRPIIGLADQARRIIENPLPIKCLEAVVVGIYLINEISSSTLEKFTIGFKTSSHGNIHRHVVLGVYDHLSARFGAIGLSRRVDLGFKPLEYTSLTDLLLDYIQAYTRYMHRVRRIRISLPIAKSNRSFECIGWNGVCVAPNHNNSDISEWSKLVEKHSRVIRHHSMDIKQSTTLSLRHLNQANGDRNGGSYLRSHLERQASYHTAKKKKLKQQKNASCQDLGIFETETFVTDSDSDDTSKEKNRMVVNKGLSSFLPHTAPAYHGSSQMLSTSIFPNIRKSGEQMSSASLLKKRDNDDDKMSKSLRV